MSRVRTRSTISDTRMLSEWVLPGGLYYPASTCVLGVAIALHGAHKKNEFGLGLGVGIVLLSISTILMLSPSVQAASEIPSCPTCFMVPGEKTKPKSVLTTSEVNATKTPQAYPQTYFVGHYQVAVELYENGTTAVSGELYKLTILSYDGRIQHAQFVNVDPTVKSSTEPNCWIIMTNDFRELEGLSFHDGPLVPMSICYQEGRFKDDSESELFRYFSDRKADILQLTRDCRAKQSCLLDRETTALIVELFIAKAYLELSGFKPALPENWHCGMSLDEQRLLEMRILNRIKTRLIDHVIHKSRP